MVRVIESDDSELTDSLISATNNQTTLPKSALRATDPIHRSLEMFFLANNYYYDRRKNYYKNSGKPSSRIFSLQNVAQAMESILHKNPSKARTSPALLFTNQKDYDAIFMSNYHEMTFLNTTLICNYVNKLIGSIDIENRNMYRNFKFHLSRIFTTYLLEKEDYSDKDFKQLLDLENKNELFNISKHKLDELLEQYQNNNPDVNIINISKSKSFSNYINDQLKL